MIIHLTGHPRGGLAGHHVCGRGVGFSPPDVLICHRLGLILLHFGPASEASRGFCAAGAIFLDQKLQNIAEVIKVSSKKKKTSFDML
jgi:hypothetical protein